MFSSSRRITVSAGAPVRRFLPCMCPLLYLLAANNLPILVFDVDLRSLFESLASSPLGRLILFENFNQKYPLQYTECDPIRIPTFDVSRAAANASLKLEHLSASSMVDASYFFHACQPSWK